MIVREPNYQDTGAPMVTNPYYADETDQNETLQTAHPSGGEIPRSSTVSAVNNVYYE